MANGPSSLQKFYYATALVPMWRGQLDELGSLARDYRNHLLALDCLRRAKGPGGDPVQVAEFCRKWQIPLTLPVIGPTSLLRKFAKAVGGWPSAGALFDITGALGVGVKIMAQVGPLLGKLQMRNALLYALDLPSGDQSAVGEILESAGTPTMLFTRFKQSSDRLESKWKDIQKLAEKMEAIRKELGLPEDQL